MKEKKKKIAVYTTQSKILLVHQQLQDVKTTKKTQQHHTKFNR
jgi:hypothetical protein